MVDRALIAELRALLAAAGDPARAAAQQAYMRSAMPYAGVRLPDVRHITRAAAGGGPVDDETVRAVWRGARVREERYAAVELCRRRPNVVSAMPLYEEMIVDGAWWDHVDEVATHLVGPLVLAHPDELAPVMRRWGTDPDRWKRRTAIICQVGAGHRLDTGLLTDCVEPNLEDHDFFIRKAIGWALRQHARVDPDWVRAFVVAHPTLSPLSRKEALRHLGS